MNAFFDDLESVGDSEMIGLNTTGPNPLRILVADAEQAILSLYKRVLMVEKDEPHSIPEEEELERIIFEKPTISTSLSFDLVLCHQIDEAITAVKTSLEENRPFAVAFLGIRLSPERDGLWAAEQIRMFDPHVEIVMITEYFDINIKDIICRVPPIHKLLYLEKPLRPKEINQFASALGSKWQTEYEFRQVHEELEKWLEERTTELVDTNEHLAEEIEERNRAEEELRKSEEKHRIMLESVPDPVVVYDMEGKITYFNPAFSRIFGWTLDEGRGQSIDFVPIEHLLETELIFDKIKDGETISGVETCRLAKAGEKIDVSISGKGFFDKQGQLQGSVITIQDIRKRKKTEEEIRFIAYHDVLTGLPNRKSFYMRLEEEKLLQSYSPIGNKRRGTAHKWALLFLDLDRFKNINDTLGHDVGDELLRSVSGRVQRCLRKSDYIFRLGGDEFTVILNDLTHDTDVAKVAQKIRDEVARPFQLNTHVIYITVSIGISVYPGDGDNIEKLVKNADMAMYEAKEDGQGYRFFTETMNAKALERMELESSLHTALQQNQFVIYYQPLVDDRSTIMGTEALLRWYHPKLEVISPGKFIPLAEETGVIVPVGIWVLHSACQQLKDWYDMGYKDFYVAVNLSNRQFREPDLIDTIEQALEKTGLPPKCLKLEVTEAGIMENPEQAIAKMQILRAKGIHFSIDDFGTGYSSLIYLKRFPIDILKIDRSFIIDSTTNKDDQEIIKTIISMARNLNMNTVAEGVETKEQQDFLIRQGCHMMQGYYFARPMPAEEFEKILRANSTR